MERKIENIKSAEAVQKIYSYKKEEDKGITLVSLVVTIIILIILATVSISAVFGENGIVKQAQLAKSETESMIGKEQRELNQLMQEYANIMNGESGGIKPPEEGKVLVTGITLSQSIAEITEGETLTLTAIITPINATNKTTSWVSSNPEIATVNNGVITGVAAGTATITASSTDGSNKTSVCTIIVKSSAYVDSELITSPKLTEGLTPVKYNESTSKWVKTTEKDNEWYDYANKKWANAVLGDATFDSSGNLDETKAYSMVVWIPRYAYKITSGWHKDEAEGGDIDIIFIDTNNRDKSGMLYNETYVNAINGVIKGGSMKNYVLHPAFDYGSTKLEVFWVGKFESSHTSSGATENTGRYDGTDKTMQIKAGVASWRYIKVTNAFTVCTELNKSGNSHGLITDDAIVNPHMVKNIEWGALAYLSKSKYGIQTKEIWINNNANYLTGQAGTKESSTYSTYAYNTTNGVNASISGNVYGVYDMRGRSK